MVDPNGLLSCPFCGSEAAIRLDMSPPAVVCEGGYCAASTSWDTVEDAVEMWNRRAMPQVACHRTITNDAKWAWIDGPPPLGALDNLKVHPSWRIECAYLLPAGDGEGGRRWARLND